MPSILNRVPLGLLDLLDIKARGMNPRELLDTVQSVLDLSELYLVDREEAISGSVSSVAAVGLTSTITVPNSEAWLVRLQSSTATGVGAGESCTFTPYFFGRLDTSLAAYFEGPTGAPRVATAAGDTPRAFAQRPFWALSGDQLGTYVEQIVGTVAFQTRAVIVRFQR